MTTANLSTLTSMMQYMGLKRGAEGISTSLEGRCAFVDLKVEVIDYIEVETEPATDKKKAKVSRMPSVIKLTPVNQDIDLSKASRSALRRAFIELSPSVYALGTPQPFQRILEPTEGDLVPSVLVALASNAIVPKSIQKGMRIYFMD